MHGVQQHPRYRVSVPVGLVTSSGAVEELAIEDISLGGLFIRTTLPAPAGSFVRLRLPVDTDGALSLMGRVVHVIDEVASRAQAHAPGMGVQFDGLSPDTQRSLARFVEALVVEQQRRPALARVVAADGTPADVSDRATPARAHGELAGVLTQARRLIARLAVDDLHGAIDLPHDASDDDVTVRVHALALAFAAVHDESSPPQRARLEEARRALARLAALLALPAFVGKPIETEYNNTFDPLAAAKSDVFAPFVPVANVEDAGGIPASTKPGQEYLGATQLERARIDALSDDQHREELAELIAEAEFLESAGRPKEAQSTLLDARELAPDNTGVTRRLATLADHIDATEATALLDDAERLPRNQRVAHAQRAARLTSSRAVLLRAMRMLASVGALDDMLAVAEHLAELFPQDQLSRFAILQVNERSKRWAVAARAGDALLRLRPDDYELHERVVKLVALAGADDGRLRRD